MIQITEMILTNRNVDNMAIPIGLRTTCGLAESGLGRYAHAGVPLARLSKLAVGFVQSDQTFHNDVVLVAISTIRNLDISSLAKMANSSGRR